MTSKPTHQPLTEQSRHCAAGDPARRTGFMTTLGFALAISCALIACGGGGGIALGAGNGSLDASASQGASTTDSVGVVAASPSSGDASSVAGVSSGGTGSVTVGVVTGFGSIILNGNGVRIEDAAASVTDENGANKKGLLRLGMQATVQSSTAASGVVTAQSVVIGGDLQGRVGRIDAGQKRFDVLGQTVIVVGGTVFDASLPSGLGSMSTNDLVEVHGVLDAERHEITATFLEKKTSVPFFKVQGLVENLDLANKVFSIDGLKVAYAMADLRTPLVQGALVRVRLPSLASAPAMWQATQISGPAAIGPDREQFEIEGRISNFVSAASFNVDGVPVDASAALFASGTASLASGVRVEVTGRLSGGRLIAVRVKIEEERELDQREFQLTGRISQLVANGASGSFELRGYTVEYGSETQYRAGAAAGLMNGVLVEVRGVAAGGAQGTRVAATRVEFQ